MAAFAETNVEEAALAWVAELGYATANGQDTGPDAVRPERARCCWQGEGVPVETRRPDGNIGGEQARLVDLDDPDANDWLAVNQVTVIENGANRRADVVVYVNGLPLGVAELKNPGDGNATLDGAWNQLQTYKAQIPLLFRGNAALVISDGLAARIGSLTANRERFVVVIADEAHRSQYGFEARVERRTGEVSYGFARRLRDALPNASFTGFTGTPVETADVSTLAVFGDYTDVYDIGRAGGDGRAGAAADRPRAGAAGADQRHRRLDAARGGARQHPPGDAAVNQQ